MERSSRPLHLLTIGVVTLLALAPTAEVGAQELEVVLEVYSGSTSYVVLEAGMAAGATDGYDPGIDIYAPPPPPIPSFDAAITWANDRWYRSIIAPTPLEVVFGIALQFDGPAGIGIDWDPSALASQGSFQLQDPFGGLFVDIDMTVESGVVLTSTSLTRRSR